MRQINYLVFMMQRPIYFLPLGAVYGSIPTSTSCVPVLFVLNRGFDGFPGEKSLGNIGINIKLIAIQLRFLPERRAARLVRAGEGFAVSATGFPQNGHFPTLLPNDMLDLSNSI